MGGGSQTKSENTVQKNDPWYGQQPYLTNAFTEAQRIYDDEKVRTQPGYQGDFYATARPEMENAFKGALDWSSGTGMDAATTAARAGTGQMTTGAAGATGAMGGLFGLAAQDPTKNNIASANAYAANPYLNQMVDASMSDAKRSALEDTLPQIDRDAAASGNLNSTRTAIKQGIVDRGLQEKAATIGAQLRSGAWDTGLQTATQDTASRMGALTAAGGLGSDLLKTGSANLQGASDIASTNAQTGLLSSTYLNGIDQQAIDNQLAKVDYQNSLPWANLSNFWGIVGDKSWGGTTTTSGTSTVKNNPSILSTLGSGLGVLGSLFKSDRRTKKDIEHVTTLPDGIKLYTFRYIDDENGVLHTAPMAQEVQEKYPEAVREIDGTLYIDTDKYDWR